MPGRSLAPPDAGRLALDLLRAGEEVSLVAGGHSMSPAIRHGDRLVLVPLRARPRTGEVLAATIDGRLVVHRLVRRRGGWLELRGDAAPASDRPLPAAAAVGILAAAWRDGRRVRFGLGPERRLLAWLSRRGLLRGAARGRERLRAVPRVFGIRLACPVVARTRRGLLP
jgi:hypothetical protein